MEFVVLLSTAFVAAQAQNFLDFQPVSSYHGNLYHHQNYQNFPPHFRPFGYPQLDRYQALPNKPINFQSFYPNQYNYQPLRSPFIPHYPQYYPQYDDTFQDLNDLNKIPPTLREPIQLIPSRFPPSVENFVERVQNHFSIYNPVIPHLPANFLPAAVPAPEKPTKNSTEPTPADPDVETISPVSSTESPAIQAEAGSEDVAVRADAEENKSLPDTEQVDENAVNEHNVEPITEESTTESSTESDETTETTEVP